MFAKYRDAHIDWNYKPVTWPEKPRDVKVTFTNNHTGETFSRVYKTLPAAKAAVTRYINKLYCTV